MLRAPQDHSFVKKQHLIKRSEVTESLRLTDKQGDLMY